MIELNKKELMNVNGGFSFALGLLIAGAIVFIIGVIDGYIRPTKCNK